MSPEVARDWRLYADDILAACDKIRRFVAGMSYEQFVADDRTCDAVIRNLEVIGEAAKRIPDEVAGRAPQVPWRLIRGMRDVLAHAYFGLSLPVVWDTATTQVDELEVAVRALIG